MGTFKGVHHVLSRYRQAVAMGLYGLVSVATFVTAYVVRFEFTIPETFARDIWAYAGILLAVRLLAFRLLNLSLERWRHIGTHDVARLVAAATLGSAWFIAILLVMQPVTPVPRSVLLVDWMLVILVVSGLWITYRSLFEVVQRQARLENGTLQRAILIGAGETGSRLVKEMLRDPMGYRPVGYLDDDPVKQGIRLHGLPVEGPVSNLPVVAKKWDADALIIALPSATLAELREVVDSCVETGLPFKVLPSTEEVLAGHVGTGQLREVKLDDLLGRDPIQLALPQLGAELDGKTVLITGGAGSIGSELCRQIALNGPGRLVLLDKSESDVFDVDLDLRHTFPDLDMVTIVGDLLDETLLEQVFRDEKPAVVFHAAAYKHVPLMERNARSAVLNNVLGTSLVAELAGTSGVERFVLVSTDKAVQPANVMGATKQAAELITLDCSGRFPNTWYTAVRFGNVLGSRGSVVPLFERQLAAGRPLTVTHPEVTRYFMTIPEAVQLLLQASILPEARGQIAMLDMGDPVLIVDLARKLIRLKGLREGVDARIEFCGLRPGEKLHERLSAAHEQTRETEITKIRIVASSAAWVHDDMSLRALRGRLQDGQATSHESAVNLLCEIVPEFGQATTGVPMAQLAGAM